MRYSAKREAKNAQAPAPIESIIPLLDPVKIYSAKELAAMPLSQMNAAIEAQESYYILEHTTQMGGASYFYSSTNAKWREACSGQRKVTYPIQDKQRICRASNYTPVGETWPGQIGVC